MTYLETLILGITEGVTEFLPISSTGHLILLSHYLKIEETDFLKLFLVVVQLGAILAVVVYYKEKFLQIRLLKKLALAFLPTGIAGFLLYKHIKALLGEGVSVGVTLLLGGIVMLFVELWYAKMKDEGHITATHELSYKESFILGLCQVAALIPGTSRSASVIVGGLLMKLERKTVTEFAFLLAVPTMLMATLYSLYKSRDVLMHAGGVSHLLVGTLISFVVALGVIKWLLDYIKKHSFIPFALYRIALGIVVLFTLLH